MGWRSGDSTRLPPMCGLRSNPSVDNIKCGSSLLLVFFLATRGFSPGTPFFSSTKKQTPASFPVVLGDFGCDVTCQACRENSSIALGSKPPLVTRIARTGLGRRLECASVKLSNVLFISKPGAYLPSSKMNCKSFLMV